ncbi:hypothetical protein RFI_01642 [Reticulomyxa filosa]|uniref:Uncharacterized protein n=1 Tax=Reticulomyxa filosa TaxID=46433 RepID=X6PB87_RETFI|nr:hypothetical protein RFI_01642 [Reticulomyxa filosa]|eukprot:ETO35421.1 hypothetical protein RFI_01642 [Reticulomyxa filosa]
MCAPSPNIQNKSVIEEDILVMENEITELIRKDNGCSAHFRYSYQGHKVRVQLVTFNPKHRSTFLVHELECQTRYNALTDMLQYVKDRVRDEEKCYSVTWKMKESALTTKVKRTSQNFREADASSDKASEKTNSSNSDSYDGKSSVVINDINEAGFTTSHFYANDIYQLLEKFFYDKNKDDYIIYQDRAWIFFATDCSFFYFDTVVSACFPKTFNFLFYFFVSFVWCVNRLICPLLRTWCNFIVRVQYRQKLQNHIFCFAVDENKIK